jgi:hypothetical protein
VAHPAHPVAPPLNIGKKTGFSVYLEALALINCSAFWKQDAWLVYWFWLGFQNIELYNLAMWTCSARAVHAFIGFMAISKGSVGLHLIKKENNTQSYQGMFGLETSQPEGFVW